MVLKIGNTFVLDIARIRKKHWKIPSGLPVILVSLGRKTSPVTLCNANLFGLTSDLLVLGWNTKVNVSSFVSEDPFSASHVKTRIWATSPQVPDTVALIGTSTWAIFVYKNSSVNELIAFIAFATKYG
jgi:hypothetical protein